MALREWAQQLTDDNVRLQAENARLRAELERVTKERDEANERLVSQCAFTGDLQAEIAAVKAERAEFERRWLETGRDWLEAAKKVDELQARLDAQNALIVQGDRMRLEAVEELERVTKERDEIAKLHYKEQTHRKAIERKREIDSVTRKMLVSQEELYDWLDVIGERVIEARAEAIKWYRLCLEARRVAATRFSSDITPDYIDDGFGMMEFRWCYYCGGDMAIVRPGDARCARCGK